MSEYKPLKGNEVQAEDLMKLYNHGREVYRESYENANEAWDMYHGRQLTDEQIQKLAERGQPAEIFNCVRLNTNYMRGYFANTTNTVRVSPQQVSDIQKAAVMNDLINYIFRRNQFESVGDYIKIDGMITGIFCCYKRIQLTGQKDELGKPIKEIILEHVPATELVLDPLSKNVDYARDARFLHRFKWIHADDVIRMFGAEELHNLRSSSSEAPDSEYSGYDPYMFHEGDYFNIIHTIYKDIKNDYWCFFWSGDHIIKKYKITDDNDKFPYRVVKLQDSTKPEFYGVFRDVIETQKAINQAILKIQLTVNTQRIFVGEGAVQDINKFIDDVNSVNAVIPVRQLSQIQIENLGPEIRDQYNIIINGLNRIQQVLGINDSFRGEADATDSGRKVQIQQQSTITALRYLTERINQFYRLLARDIFNLVKAHYTAHQVVRIADEYSGERWLEINKPMRRIVKDEQGNPAIDEQGNIKSELITYQQRDNNGAPIYDKNGIPEYGAVYLPSSEINIDHADIEVDTVSHNDQQEKDYMFLETLIQGAPGQALMQSNISGYYRLMALSAKSLKVRYSEEAADIFLETANLMQQQGNVPPEKVSQSNGRPTPTPTGLNRGG